MRRLIAALAAAFTLAIGAPAMAQTTPRAAADFINMQGWNGQLVTNYVSGTGAGSTYAQYLAAMNYLGVYFDREYVPVPGWTLPTYQALNAKGLKFDIETQINADNTSGKINIPEDIQYFKQITPSAVSSSVPWYEGPNEFNLNSYNYNGSNSYNNFTWSRPVEQAMRNALNADATISNIKILMSSIALATNGNLTTLGNHADIVDAANWHAYTQNGQLPYPNMLEGQQKTANLAVGKPFWFTEFGCSNYNGSQGWGSCGDANVTAPRIVLDYFADAFLVGAQKAIYYELFDGTATYTTSDDIENNFGLFKKDGTAKPQATAMHNINTILADTGTATLTALSYSVTNLPASGHQVLMRKSNGDYYLMLWAEPVIWNDDGNQDNCCQAAPPNVNVTVGLTAAHTTLAVYDPLSGTTAIKTASNANSIVATVTDHPLLVLISNALTSGGTGGTGGTTNACKLH